MAPAETVLKYGLERSRWSIAITRSEVTLLELTFDNDSVINPYVENREFNVPLTLDVTLPVGWVASVAQAVQNGLELAAQTIGGQVIRFDADPWGGVVTVNRTAVVAVAPLRVHAAQRTPTPGARSLLVGIDGRLVRSTSWSVPAVLFQGSVGGVAVITLPVAKSSR